MSDFDRVERDREANEGLVYESWWDDAVGSAAEDDDEGERAAGDGFHEEGR